MMRFTKNGAGAAYSLGRPISTLAARFVDDAQLPELKTFAEKFDGVLFDASDLLETAKAKIDENQRFRSSMAPVLCTWLVTELS